MLKGYILPLLLVRVVLPAGLLLSIALRPFGLSLIYLLLFLLAPLAQVPDSRTFKGWRGRYLCLVASLSFLLLLVHAVWHSVLAGFSPYGSLLEEYPLIQLIGLNLGLVSYQGIEPLMAVHYVAPELIMMSTSLVVYLFVKKLLAEPGAADIRESKHQQYPLLTSAGKYISLFLIMFSGIMRPSITSGIYFLVFLGAATAWAVGRPLQKGFAVVGKCLMAIMAAHITVMLAYQCTWAIEFYPPDKDLARYFGLTKLVSINQTQPNSFHFEVTYHHMWATLASPLIILFTYFVLAIQTRELFKPKAKKKSALTGLEAGKANGPLGRVMSFHRGTRSAARDKWMSATNKLQVAFSYLSSKEQRGNASETTPLMRQPSESNKLSSIRRSSANKATQDSTGSVTLPDDDPLFMDEDDKPTLMDEIISAVLDFFQVLVRSSYIATTITMMAWSIMFHSWLTFVLLMWANIVWLCQDQRSFMLKTSPILVCYAMLLLLAQYIYGMDLHESELPSNITEVNLSQIGLDRSDAEPCVNLLIKSLFTCMFWVTLRQRVHEISQRRRSALITDMAAPLQLTVSAAGSADPQVQREEETKSRLLRSFGEWLRAMCARYWIYVVVIMLFVIGITGERMTIFRIIYMFLFLAFILMFQISWYWWRRLMYIFWIIVIIYSMLNLILIYIYQFDNFSKLIETYLLINERLQHDLGLDRYHPADLFVKLLTPTLFLIITIMQVHYFHKDFLALSNRRNSLVGNESSRPSYDAPTLPNESQSRLDVSVSDARSMHSSSRNTAHNVPSVPDLLSEKHDSLMTVIRKMYQRIRKFLGQWIDKSFIYLEINLVKIIYLALMLLCAMNACALHVPIMILISPALWMSTRTQRVCVLIISTLISVYFMAKMVYQIDYIPNSLFEVNCTSISSVNFTDVEVQKTYNNAEWFGFTKATSQKPLVVILKGYIALIAVFTFHSLVIYRQQALRDEGLLPKDNKDQKHQMFPEIQRKDADIDLIHCFKYLVNYGFYKFGVEVSLICLMGVIGSRMDVYAVFYAGWLMLLVSMRRVKLARTWPAFTAFIALIIPLQYMIAVGFLPHLCVLYPWCGESEQMKHIRAWLFLPYADDPPHAAKIIFDYILLLFASRQLRVFNIEKTRGDQYPGGSNSEDIGKDWETPNFVNPVPDFLGYVDTWLDVVKRMIFLGMLWVTLAIMFMTGTNRVNLFSMGYLIGSFIFLWQGTDFYLRPKDAILRWWSWLLRYNVGVVVVKTILQIPGCIFSEVMQDNACWLVQLLGIGCVDKFVGGNIARFLKMHVNSVQTCSVPQEDIGLAWDGVCFAFLILQRRLFHSYYFFRVIDESKATTVLASRGADLIEELRQKKKQVQEETETKILEKIKVKMERIKANQKKIQGAIVKEPRHHDAEEEEEETQHEESEQVPLVRGDSDVSGRGYHTPDSPASPRGFHTPISEPSAPPSPEHRPPTTIEIPFPVLPPTSSHGGPPSPSSALMTVSLDAYLEPRRISFGSPPSSELLPRAQSPEESYPVFSPPPIRRRHTVASPSLQQRTSIMSQSSRAEPHSHHTSRDRPQYRPPTSHQKAVRSGDYYMFDEFDDTEDQLKDVESSDDEENPNQMGFGKLLSTVIKTDLKHAVRRASAPNVRSMDRRSPQSYPSEGRHPVTGAEGGMVSLLEGPDDAMDSDMEDSEPEVESWYTKLKNLLKAVWAFISSILISLTRHLMKFSRDYRYVSRTLAVEKKILKENAGFGIGLREGSQMIWEPLPVTITPQNRKLSDISVPEIRLIAPSMERGLDASPPSHRASPSPQIGQRDHQVDQLGSETPQDYDDDTSEHESAFSLQTTSSKDVTTLEEQDDSLFKPGKSSIVHFVNALWYAVLAHTDIVCYIMVFINQIQSATILSIPLPLMVFLWGTLSIPRPTKTFWVTLIAYTEVIVLIKSMFQFEILPWNQKTIPVNMPFTAPRIIGIERKFNYALYDLLLLLIIFLHRFVLKSLGLWKESTTEIEMREDVDYEVTAEDTQMFVEGKGDEVGRKYVLLHDTTGPRHHRADRLYHVIATITTAMRELNATRSDPRVVALVWHKLQANQNRRRKHESYVQVSARKDRRRNKDEERKDEDEAGPSQPNDELNTCDNQEEEPIISVTTKMENTYLHYPDVILLSVKRYLRPMHKFFTCMLAPGARVTADVYAYMFLCDFFNFMVVIFGFAAFGTHQGDGGVQAYLEENKVPFPFLIMLILQFGLIIIDRALYLRKYMLGKILFQYGLIIGVHVWMFFVLPFITERTFNALLPPPMWYMIKCIYLLLSAYQIRCGYPRRIIGNFLCKSYSFLNMVFFRGFMTVPFVFELRTLMDWIWTDTSMTLLDWLKMEDIFASVFLLKCSRYVDDEFPQPRGRKKSSTSKYLLGGGVLAFVIAIIWFPLVFFAFGNSVGIPNPPTDVTVKIRIGPFLPVYQMSAQSHNIRVFTEQDFTQLSNLYARDRTAQTFLSNYMYNDVAVVTINPNSTLDWIISPPELRRLRNEAKSNSTLQVKFSYVITHPTNAVPNPPTLDDSREVDLDAFVVQDNLAVRSPERDALLALLDGTAEPDTWLDVKVLFPKFLKVFNKGSTKPAYQLMPPIAKGESEDVRLYRDVQLRLERVNNSMYWRVRENCHRSDPLSSIPFNSCDMLVMYTFNDKLFPETLNIISGSGIIGLYTTFVFLASRVLRGFFSGIYTKIMFDDLPNVDRVLQLCLDIYLVREALELTLEEDLFAKLVFLYRSPETMIKWSRPKGQPDPRALPPSR